MWIKILFGVVILYLIFRFFTFLFGNWRATLNRVISQYIAWKQMEPKYSDKEVFVAVLDHRYSEKIGFMKKMHDRKNEVKESVKAEIESGISVVNKYSLPILIYTCLLIEGNNYLKSKKTVEELLAPIIGEVKRQGFGKYC